MKKNVERISKLEKDLKFADNSNKQAINSKNQMKENFDKAKKSLEQAENSRKQASEGKVQAEALLKNALDSQKQTEAELSILQKEFSEAKINNLKDKEMVENVNAGKVGGLQEQIDALKVKLADAESEASAAKAAAGDSGAAAAELVEVKSQLQKVQAELESDKVSHEKTSKEIWQKLDAANSEKDKIQSSLDDQVKKTSAVQEQLDALNGTYDTVSNELNDYKVTLSEVQVKLESFETVENQLKAENASLKTQLENKQTTPTIDTSAFESKISSLNSQIACLITEKSEFQAKSNRAEQKLEKTLVMLDKIESHVNEEAQKSAKIQSDKAVISKKLEASEAECNNLKETVSQIKTKLVGLQSSFDNQVDDLNKKNQRS